MYKPIVLALLAIGVLLLVVASVRFLYGWRRTHYSFAQYILFRFAGFLVRWQWRAELPERLQIADAQGAVIICNHRSSIDPFFIQILLDRPARWMVAREYVEHWAFRWFLRTCEVIPASRTGIDTAATKHALRAASRGQIVGMLPEGRINTTEAVLLPCRPGPILVALRAQVPIIPVFIHDAPYGGTPWSPLLRRARTRVVAGDPIDLSSYYERSKEDGVVAEVALLVYHQLAQLGGYPEFEPQLAGRRWKHGLTEAEKASEA
ncbi:MAG: lysophospholipid acyltransferase family protein [Pirellulales bacterium]